LYLPNSVVNGVAIELYPRLSTLSRNAKASHFPSNSRFDQGPAAPS
jgi:hypothetical protein